MDGYFQLHRNDETASHIESEHTAVLWLGSMMITMSPKQLDLLGEQINQTKLDRIKAQAGIAARTHAKELLTK